MKVLANPQSGSYADKTASRNRFGQYFRTRATPVNPNTSYQSTARGRLVTLSTSWRDLTEAQRLAWVELGSQMVRTDSLGQTQTLTGLQAFISVNSVLLGNGQAVRTEAPPLAVFTAPPGFLSITIQTGSSIELDFQAGALVADDVYQIWGTPPVSAGILFSTAQPLLRLLGYVTVNAAQVTANNIALGSIYDARFGAPSESDVDKKVFIGVAQVVDGQTGLRIVKFGVVESGA